jgi:CRP-like cAMP-binding protein
MYDSSLPKHEQGNGLLAVLPAEIFDRLVPDLKSVSLRLGETLHETDGEVKYAYFPTTAIVSLASVLKSGASAELAGVGNEGMVGVSLLLGGDTTSSAAVVRKAGHAYRIEARALKQDLGLPGPLPGVFLRYTQALMTQIAQAAACNRVHSIEQQLCRWLLSTLDRGVSNELVVTQELVAAALGVRREGITEAAGRLQRADIIRYRRGHISVLDRTALETGACECYAVVKAELTRLLSDKRLR